ncbi:MAG: hypothetical protein WB699_12095 [Bacteroidota bacterium]
MTDWEKNILHTLLYFDLWQYPLSEEELFAFFPAPCSSLSAFREQLREHGPGQNVSERYGYYYLSWNDDEIVERRKRNERHARGMWRIARVAAHIIKRFPFVRGVFVSGDLSKNVTTRKSDVDFYIVTAPGRLWIARALLIAFKKVFLFNRKKFFCLNTFSSSSRLDIDERNVYAATEVATLKPLFNSTLFLEFLRVNGWILQFFPNFDIGLLPQPRCSERRSVLQRILEAPFAYLPSDRLDGFLMHSMKRVWARRYPEFDARAQERQFHSTKDVSRAYPKDVQAEILTVYAERLRTVSPRLSPVKSPVSL